MKTTLMALLGSFLLVTAATAAPPAPAQAPLQAPGKSAAQAPTQAPTQAPMKGQANAGYAAPNMAYNSGGYRTYSYQPSAGYRSYSYQPTPPRPYTPELVPQGFLNYPNYQRPVTGAGFNPAGYKSTGMWMMP
jgi:hypothetical protein